jgi:hypothetical protein
MIFKGKPIYKGENENRRKNVFEKLRTRSDK